MLLTVGDLLEEILIQLRSPPRQGVDSTVRSARVRGGSAANVAAIDAERGGSPRFVGQVGNDALGQILTDELEGRGVDVQVSRLGGTGVSVTTVGRGRRTRLIDRGASRGPARLDPAVLDGVPRSTLRPRRSPKTRLRRQSTDSSPTFETAASLWFSVDRVQPTSSCWVRNLFSSWSRLRSPIRSSFTSGSIKHWDWMHTHRSQVLPSPSSPGASGRP